LIGRLLRKLPVGRRVVELIIRNFTLLESLDQQLGHVADTQRVALEDRTQQLEAAAQLIEIGRANAATLHRLVDLVPQFKKDLQQATHRLEDAVLQLTKNLQQATEQLQTRSAIYISANAYESANPEIGLLTYLSGSLRDRVALDIGAHIGEFSDRLLDCGMSVHAFEPSPLTFAQLSDRLAGRPGFTAHPIAVGYVDREMDLYVASTTSREGKYKDVSEYNSLVRHSMLNDLVFTNTIKVKVRSLHSLHAAREIPDNIGVIKIDAEGYDLEIIRGMGDCTSDILMTEFWDKEHPFGVAGAANRLNESVRELQRRDFSSYLIIYREATSGRLSFYCNSPRTVRWSWGNAIFFRDSRLFAEARRWCASVMPPTFFTG
jgi:FkbM family methyltransferase